mgnify:FL=1
MPTDYNINFTTVTTGTFDPNSQRVINLDGNRFLHVGYQDSGAAVPNSTGLVGQVVTVPTDGSTPTTAGATQILLGTVGIFTLQKISADRILILYGDVNNRAQVNSIVVTVSGNVITPATALNNLFGGFNLNAYKASFRLLANGNLFCKSVANFDDTDTNFTSDTISIRTGEMTFSGNQITRYTNFNDYKNNTTQVFAASRTILSNSNPPENSPVFYDIPGSTDFWDGEYHVRYDQNGNVVSESTGVDPAPSEWRSVPWSSDGFIAFNGGGGQYRFQPDNTRPDTWMQSTWGSNSNTDTDIPIYDIMPIDDTTFLIVHANSWSQSIRFTGSLFARSVQVASVGLTLSGDSQSTLGSSQQVTPGGGAEWAYDFMAPRGPQGVQLAADRFVYFTYNATGAIAHVFE